MGIGRIFSRGAPLEDFSLFFLRGQPKVMNFVFSSLKTKKTTFFSDIFKFQGAKPPLSFQMPSTATECSLLFKTKHNISSERISVIGRYKRGISRSFSVFFLYCPDMVQSDHNMNDTKDDGKAVWRKTLTKRLYQLVIQWETLKEKSVYARHYACMELLMMNNAGSRYLLWLKHLLSWLIVLSWLANNMMCKSEEICLRIRHEQRI